MWVYKLSKAFVACLVSSATIIRAAAVASSTLDFSCVYIQLGNNIGHHVSQRIFNYIYAVKGVKSVSILDFDQGKETILRNISNSSICAEDENRLIISFGDGSLSQAIISQAYLNTLPHESFVLSVDRYPATSNSDCLSQTPLTARDDYNYSERNDHDNDHFINDSCIANKSANSIFLIASNGLPLDMNTHLNVSFNKQAVHYGALVGAYAALELVGFGFLHPLEPYIPPLLRLHLIDAIDSRDCKSASPANSTTPASTASSSSTAQQNKSSGGTGAALQLPYMRSESPHWAERAFHIHTQHPLELTEVLQGHDIPQFGPHGPACQQFKKRKPPDYFTARRGASHTSTGTRGTTDIDRTADAAYAVGKAGSDDYVGELELELEDGDDFVAVDVESQGFARSFHDFSSYLKDFMYPPPSAFKAKTTGKVSPPPVPLPSSMQQRGASRKQHSLGSYGSKRIPVFPDTDREGSRVPYCERWEDMVTDVDYLFEWAVANRLNKIEWLLLSNYKWGDERETRLRRLRTLTELGHQYSLLIGADSPIGNIQQHGWYMVNVRLPFKSQVEQIQTQVDWIFSAGFDFLTTESGLSEFTHPECDLMVDLMNAFTEHVNGTWGREAGIKVHCSTGQFCKDFPDPRTGKPINFNFLPTHTHPGLGVFPHTVQVYALDDPTAGAYGNENFSYVEDYMVYEAKLGRRSVTYYPETAYWVNVDIDVPLFLPIYGQRRQHDLRRIALREAREAFKIQGQIVFDSGWEWGYWVNDVVAARSSWDPMIPNVFKPGEEATTPSVGAQNLFCDGAGAIGDGAGSTTGECRNAEQDNGKTDTTVFTSFQARDNEWTAFATSLQPITGIFGPIFGPRLTALIVELSKAQVELLIHGRVNGQDSPNLHKLGGMAYMSGGDTWVDLPRMFGVPFTQPDKVHLREAQDPDFSHVLALLSEMHSTFATLSGEMDALYSEVLEAYSADKKKRRRAIVAVAHAASSSNNATHAAAYSNEDASQSTVRVSANPADKDSDSDSDSDTDSDTAGRADNTLSTNTYRINYSAVKILDELKDCFKMLALRAFHVRRLYQSRDTNAAAASSAASSSSGSDGSSRTSGTAAAGDTDDSTFGHASGPVGEIEIGVDPYVKAELQRQSREAIHAAEGIVSHREHHYRVPWQRIGEWRDNPTVYRFGYLWAVHSLYYWWRDQGLAEEGSYQSEHSPCYLNRMDPSEVAMGWGKYTMEVLRTFINRYTPFSAGYPLELLNCMSPPAKGYEFPKDLYHFD